MKVLNGSQSSFDAGGNLAPWMFYGSGGPGTDRRFADAPLLSDYFDVTNGVRYAKIANTGAATDWKVMLVTGTTLTGDLTITGTLTAGDVVVAP